MATLFAKIKPRCPTNNEWIKKIWYMHTCHGILPSYKEK
jgi:hypothetical protein